jgi:hypothetical protein
VGRPGREPGPSASSAIESEWQPRIPDPSKPGLSGTDLSVAAFADLGETTKVARRVSPAIISDRWDELTRNSAVRQIILHGGWSLVPTGDSNPQPLDYKTEAAGVSRRSSAVFQSDVIS